MSRLIDADALLEKLKSEWAFLSHDDYVQEVTNAPAVEQGEPVAETAGNSVKWLHKRLSNFPCGIKLYTAPPQPQTVKDALEEAARICDACGYGWAGVAAERIRALIEKD